MKLLSQTAEKKQEDDNRSCNEKDIECKEHNESQVSEQGVTKKFCKGIQSKDVRKDVKRKIRKDVKRKIRKRKTENTET